MNIKFYIDTITPTGKKNETNFLYTFEDLKWDKIPK